MKRIVFCPQDWRDLQFRIAMLRAFETVGRLESDIVAQAWGDQRRQVLDRMCGRF